MPEVIVWSGRAVHRAGTTFLAAIPDGWKWCWMPERKLIATHPDHPPREFDAVTQLWSECVTVNGRIEFVEMDPQPA